MLSSVVCFAFHLGAPVPGSAGTWISLPIDAQVTALHGRPATVYFVAAFQPTDLPSPPILTGPCQSSTDYCRATERAVWRNLFDYYVFQTSGDPLAHLPPALHGLMGMHSLEQLREIKALLAHSLSRP